MGAKIKGMRMGYSWEGGGQRPRYLSTPPPPLFLIFKKNNECALH